MKTSNMSLNINNINLMGNYDIYIIYVYFANLNGCFPYIGGSHDNDGHFELKTFKNE